MKDTPTPRTDEWETYCDEWYYHLWRLRRKNERGFNDGFHINNGDEAKGLCDLLNNLEAKLTAASEYADKLAAGLPDGMLPKDVEVLREANLGLAVELTAVTEQRDRLAEALRKAISWGDSASHHILHRQDINWTYLNEAKEALQSLTTTEP